MVWVLAEYFAAAICKSESPPPWIIEETGLFQIRSGPSDPIVEATLRATRQHLAPILITQVEVFGQAIDRFCNVVSCPSACELQQWQHDRLEVRERPSRDLLTESSVERMKFVHPCTACPFSFIADGRRT